MEEQLGPTEDVVLEIGAAERMMFCDDGFLFIFLVKKGTDNERDSISYSFSLSFPGL